MGGKRDGEGERRIKLTLPEELVDGLSKEHDRLLTERRGARITMTDVVREVLWRGLSPEGRAFGEPRPAQAELSGRARILIVDDDPSFLEAVGFSLERDGYAVEYARNGEEALSLLPAFQPNLLLIDLVMPVLDGWALVERLRRGGLSPRIPLLAVSAAERLTARPLEVDATLHKPFAFDELRGVLKRLLPSPPAGASA
jgi:CheY-like chemotaxis protein